MITFKFYESYDAYQHSTDIAIAFYNNNGHLILRHAILCIWTDREKEQAAMNQLLRDVSNFINFKKERVNWYYRWMVFCDWVYTKKCLIVERIRL